MSLKSYAEKIVGTNVEEFTDGSNSELFTFEKENKTLVIKITKKMSEKHVEYLKTLSNEKLIPKIYDIKPGIIIMDYIKGYTLQYLIDENEITIINFDELFDKIEKTINTWHSKGFYHNDFHEENIIVYKDGSVILIDPAAPKKYNDDLINFFDIKNEVKESLETLEENHE